MKLVDVYWTEYINRLVIECDCGCRFDGPSNWSIQCCPRCRTCALWHGVEPKAGEWDVPQMQIEL
jgi:hypothetical protein